MKMLCPHFQGFAMASKSGHGPSPRYSPVFYALVRFRKLHHYNEFTQ